jgi:hypothetical protein
MRALFKFPGPDYGVMALLLTLRLKQPMLYWSVSV